MGAKMLGVIRPSIHRFKLGEFEVSTFLDGVTPREGPHPMFGSNVEPATLQANCVANRLPPTRFENGYVPAVVNTGKELILFDTGNGQGKRGEGTGRLRPLMIEAGYRPQDVDKVVITHGHPDHILGLVEDGGPAFPNAEIIFGRHEFDYWMKGENIPDRRKENRELFVRLCGPLGPRARFIEPGEDVVSGITAVEAFGHSAGHMAYHVESAGTRLLLWADTCNQYVVSLQNPDWEVAVDDNKERAIATRKRILDMAAIEKFWVLGHHMPFPSVGYVDQVNGTYRWVPTSYQLTV